MEFAAQEEAKKPHILLIEDQERMRGTIVRILKRRSFDNVTEATTHPEALALFDNPDFSCDVILCDYNTCREMNGEEFIRTIRDRDINTPIIGISSEEDYNIAMKDAGANASIGKGNLGKDLKETMDALLGRKQQADRTR